MKPNVEHITSELLKLSNKERLEIVKFLLFLDNRNSDSENIETEWENEIFERINAIDDGTATGVEYTEAVDRINKHLSL